MRKVFKSGLEFLFGAAFFVLSSLPGAASPQSQGVEAEEYSVCGVLYDVRGGELLLDDWQLRLAPGAELSFEGGAYKEADFLKAAKMAYACAHFDRNGLVSVVHAERKGFRHKARPRLLELYCGPAEKLHKGEPVYVCVYASDHVPARLRLFIDGALIEQGQVKTGSLLYFVPFELAEGRHLIKAEAEAGGLYREEEWSVEAAGDW